MSEFFDKQKESSLVKSLIVTKYFSAWYRIMANRHSRIAYIDLFSGPGIYENGEKSTPVLIIEKALENEKIAKKLVIQFNEKNSDILNKLKENVNRINNINLIISNIEFRNRGIDELTAKEFKEINLIPALSFIDPFGYAGVTKDLITALTKDKYCDCIFFFNYNRINAGINNDKVIDHMQALFDINPKIIRKELEGLSPVQREELIIEYLMQSFSKINNKKAFLLPFRFKKSPGSRGAQTSHYLIFISKHMLGYKIMKDIMWKAGEKGNNSIGKFEFIPTTNKNCQLLFPYSQTFAELKNDLCKKFAQKTLLVKDIIEQHFYGTPFVDKNYKDALLELEKENKITCNPSKRRLYNGKPTMSDKVRITFL